MRDVLAPLVTAETPEYQRPEKRHLRLISLVGCPGPEHRLGPIGLEVAPCGATSGAGTPLAVAAAGATAERGAVRKYL